MASSRSKEAIRKALLGLLLEKPLDKITVTEVVARAGVSRVTYYRAFYSLHEVIEEVLDDIFGRVEAIVPPPSPDGTPVSRRASELSTYQHGIILYGGIGGSLPVSTLVEGEHTLTVELEISPTLTKEAKLRFIVKRR